MQFFTIASALFAAALAAPAAQSTDCSNPAHCGDSAPDASTYENVEVTKFYVSKTDAGVQNAGFTLNGDDATDLACTIGATDLPSAVTNCGDSDYRWNIMQGNKTDYAISIYHQTAPFAGKYIISDIATSCHTEGNGADQCAQYSNVTMVLVGQ